MLKYLLVDIVIVCIKQISDGQNFSSSPLLNTVYYFCIIPSVWNQFNGLPCAKSNLLCKSMFLAQLCNAQGELLGSPYVRRRRRPASVHNHTKHLLLNY